VVVVLAVCGLLALVLMGTPRTPLLSPHRKPTTHVPRTVHVPSVVSATNCSMHLLARRCLPVGQVAGLQCIGQSVCIVASVVYLLFAPLPCLPLHWVAYAQLTASTFLPPQGDRLVSSSSHTRCVGSGHRWFGMSKTPGVPLWLKHRHFL
jgi:hypothetical protein